MVAGSVENLNHQDVVVVDSRGTLLSSGSDESFAGSTGSVLDYKSQVEQYLAKKAEDMLTLVLGPGRATVKVDATIETSTVNETVEKYSPDDKVTTKEELMTKSVTGGPTPAESGAGTGTTKEETTTTEYEVGRSVQQTINMPGKIVSLSVAAFVDLSAPEPSPTEAEASAAGTAPAGSPTPPAPQLTAKDVEEVIRNAIGLKESDALKVVSATFHRPAPLAAEAEAEDLFASPQFYLDIARHGSLGVLVIGALLMLKIFGGSKRKMGAAATETALDGVAGPAHLLAAGGQSFANPTQLNQRIAAALQENPEEVKRLFRTWVESEQGAG